MSGPESHSWREVAKIVGRIFGHPNKKCRVMVCDKVWNHITNEMSYTVKFMFPHTETFKKDRVVLEKQDNKIEQQFKLLRELIDILELQAKEKEVKETDPEDFEWSNH